MIHCPKHILHVTQALMIVYYLANDQDYIEAQCSSDEIRGVSSKCIDWIDNVLQRERGSKIAKNYLTQSDRTTSSKLTTKQTTRDVYFTAKWKDLTRNSLMVVCIHNKQANIWKNNLQKVSGIREENLVMQSIGKFLNPSLLCIS